MIFVLLILGIYNYQYTRLTFAFRGKITKTRRYYTYIHLCALPSVFASEPLGEKGAILTEQYWVRVSLAAQPVISAARPDNKARLPCHNIKDPPLCPTSDLTT